MLCHAGYNTYNCYLSGVCFFYTKELIFCCPDPSKVFHHQYKHYWKRRACGLQMLPTHLQFLLCSTALWLQPSSSAISPTVYWYAELCVQLFWFSSFHSDCCRWVHYAIFVFNIGVAVFKPFHLLMLHSSTVALPYTFLILLWILVAMHPFLIMNLMAALCFCFICQ